MHIYRSCSHRIYRTKPKYLVLQPLFDKYISIQKLGKWNWFYVNSKWISLRFFGSLIYLSDKIVSYVEYSLRIQIRIIYDFISAMCMGCDESCVCRRSGTEIHSAIVRHSIGFMFVWLNSCYQCGIWSMLSTETRPGDKINAVSADGLVPNFPTTGRHGIQYFLFHFMLTFAMYIV